MKLAWFIVVGAIIATIGIGLISISSYFNQISYSYDYCYGTYPALTMNNTSVYPPAYYLCEANATRTGAKYTLYSTVSDSFGVLFTILGGVIMIASICSIIVLVYKEHRITVKIRRK